MHEKGLADRTKALELNPNLPEIWYARGSAYFLLGDFAKARDDLAQALRLRPDYTEASDVLKKAEARLAEAKIEEAPRPVEAAKPVEVKPPEPEVKPAAAPPVESTPEPAQPQPAPKPVARVPRPVAPASAAQHDLKGRALTASGNYDEAVAELTEAIRLQSDFARAYNARGYVYLLKRDYQHALADFDEAIRLDPNYANAIQNRGMALRGLGKKAGQ
jgi:tetratricopeptide (TPR) repeat protein